MNTAQAVRETLDQYYRSFQTRDWMALELLLDPTFFLFSDNASELDKTAFLKFMKETKWMVASHEISDVDCRLSAAGDMAVTRYHIRFAGSYEGKEMTLYAIETTCFLKVRDRWLLSHSHVSNKM
jgi:ketosteroid isomerase-like protein